MTAPSKGPDRRRLTPANSPQWVSAVVPWTGSPPAWLQPCIDSVLGTGVRDVTVVAVAEEGGGAIPAVSGARVVEARSGSFGAAVNAAVESTVGDVVLLVPPVARLRPSLTDRYLTALETDDRTAVAYGDYSIDIEGDRRTRRQLFADPFDLSEWSTLGYVRVLRREAWDEVGGYDASFRVAEDYDLRLRLAERFRFARVREPLYDVFLPTERRARSACLSAICRYFTPESCAMAGFGYLFLQPALEAEVERAFLASLRRHGALLEHANPPISCPHRDSSSPTVSVVIPTRDRAPLLRRAIESVLAGTFQDFEVIVVDNGSRDETVALVERLSTRDPRIRLLLNDGPNEIATALNLGIAAASGKFISQLDSDDEYLPDTLTRQVSHLEAHPTWGLAISYYEVIDEEGRILPEIGTVRHLEYDRNNILRTSGAGAVRTWHRCVLEELGGFDEVSFPSYAEDYDLVLRACERYDVGRVHATLYRARRHATNTEQKLGIDVRAAHKIEARRRALLRRRAFNSDGDRLGSAGTGFRRSSSEREPARAPARGTA